MHHVSAHCVDERTINVRYYYYYYYVGFAHLLVGAHDLHVQELPNCSPVLAAVDEGHFRCCQKRGAPYPHLVLTHDLHGRQPLKLFHHAVRDFLPVIVVRRSQVNGLCLFRLVPEQPDVQPGDVATLVQPLQDRPLNQLELGVHGTRVQRVDGVRRVLGVPWLGEHRPDFLGQPEGPQLVPVENDDGGPGGWVAGPELPEVLGGFFSVGEDDQRVVHPAESRHPSLVQVRGVLSCKGGWKVGEAGEGEGGEGTQSLINNRT